MAAYDYLDQVIVASALIQPHDNDSFYNPVQNGHSGFAADGLFYQNGVSVLGHSNASWFDEAFGPYRGDTPAFPLYGLILLSPVSMVILDAGTPTLNAAQLTLWMQFLMSDLYALANNWNAAINGWTPANLSYADGIVSVTYIPDEGNASGGGPPASVNSKMVVSMDFSQDKVYLDVAV